MCLCRCLVCFFWVCDSVFLSLCEWLMVSGDCYVSWQRCTLFSLLHKITLIMETLLISAIRISHYAIMCCDFMQFMRIACVNAGQSVPWLSFLISLINQHHFHWYIPIETFYDLFNPHINTTFMWFLLSICLHLMLQCSDPVDDEVESGTWAFGYWGVIVPRLIMLCTVIWYVWLVNGHWSYCISQWKYCHELLQMLHRTTVKLCILLVNLVCSHLAQFLAIC